MNPTNQKTHIRAIDYLRTISILAVVLIHTTTKTLEASGYNLNVFSLTLFLNQLSRFAVPLFFLISGFVLEMNYDFHLNYIAYLKKRLSKIFIPYLFWSLIYYFFVYTQNHDNFVKVILTGNASYQLYFIPTLLIFYLIFPLLHKVYRFISNIPSLIVLGGTQLFLMHKDYTVHQFDFVEPIRILLLAFYVFIIGMVAARNKDKIIEIVDKIKYLLIPLVAYLAFYVFSEGKSLYFQTYNIAAFYSQWRISVLVYTLSLAALLFYLFEQTKLKFNIIERAAKGSFFVFFVHVIVLESAWTLYGKFIFDKPMFDILFFLTVSIVSFVLAYIVRKVPQLNKLTG